MGVCCWRVGVWSDCCPSAELFTECVVHTCIHTQTGTPAVSRPVSPRPALSKDPQAHLYSFCMCTHAHWSGGRYVRTGLHPRPSPPFKRLLPGDLPVCLSVCLCLSVSAYLYLSLCLFFFLSVSASPPSYVLVWMAIPSRYLTSADVLVQSICGLTCTNRTLSVLSYHRLSVLSVVSVCLSVTCLCSSPRICENTYRTK